MEAGYYRLMVPDLLWVVCMAKSYYNKYLSPVHIYVISGGCICRGTAAHSSEWPAVPPENTWKKVPAPFPNTWPQGNCSTVPSTENRDAVSSAWRCH